MTEELYINGLFMDLPTDSVIALSFAVNTLFDVKTIQGNVSNNITLPPTKNNLKNLGFLNNLNIDLSNTVRKRASCRYVQNGIEVLSNGVVEYGTISNKGIAIVITSGNIDFFDLLDGSIQKLDLSDFDHTYDFFSIPPSRLNRVGYVYPVINYGDLNNASSHVNLRTMRPATFVKTVVDYIVKETGFELINELETNPLTSDHYRRMILPFSNDNFEHSQRAIDDIKNLELLAEATNSYHFVFPNGADTHTIYGQFNNIIKDDTHSFSLNERYTCTRDFVADITVNITRIYFTKFFLAFGQSASNDWIDFNILINGVSSSGTTRITIPGYSSGTGLFTLTSNNITVQMTGVRLRVGDVIQVQMHAINDFHGTGPACTVDVYPVVDFSIVPAISGVQFGEVVQLEATLPDISKKDFLKAVANMFGGIVQTDNQHKTVHIVPFFFIKKNTDKAVDWSDRVVNRDSEQIALSLGDYSQTNTGMYDNDDSINPPDYAFADILIADENLPTIAKELFTLPFSASKDTNVMNGMKSMLIKKIAVITDTDFTLSVNPRIAMVDFVDGVTLNYKDDLNPLFTQTVTDSVPQTYFASTIQVDLMMQTFFNRYYKEIIFMLNDQRKITVPLKLKEIDIQALDFFIPVYLDIYANYFYISKINSYVHGRPCNVDLIKLF